MGEDAFDWREHVIIYVNPGMKFDIEAHVDVRVVRLPRFDTKVGDRTLGELRHLREVKLQEGLEIIGENWFADSDIEKVVVPASVKEIQVSAFRGCDKLVSINF